MIFIDTNVLVYARTAGVAHHETARRLLDEVMTQGEVAISRQVIREYLAVVTRAQLRTEPLSMEQAWQDVEVLTTRFRVLDNNRVVLDNFRSLCMDVPVAGARVHDANIVATMLAHGVRRLLTFDRADFRRFGGYITFVDTA